VTEGSLSMTQALVGRLPRSRGTAEADRRATRGCATRRTRRRSRRSSTSCDLRARSRTGSGYDPDRAAWHAGLRVGEALALAETDLDRSRGAVLVRRAKGARRREVCMGRWACESSVATRQGPRRPPAPAARRRRVDCADAAHLLVQRPGDGPVSRAVASAWNGRRPVQRLCAPRSAVASRRPVILDDR